MKRMTMQQKLSLYPTLEKDVQDLSEKIRMEKERLKSAYDVSAYVLTDMPVGKGAPGDPCGNTVVNRIMPGWDRVHFLQERIDEKIAIINDVERFLDKLDALELAIIKLRYFGRLTWCEIGDTEHISVSTAHRLHESAERKYNSTLVSEDEPEPDILTI